MSTSSSGSSSNATATVIAVGALAATLAAVCHETLGHGLACIGAGGHVTLLTSIWFRCSKWAPIIDVSGPLGNLLAGVGAVALLGYTRPGAAGKLLLFLLGALNLFWFTGQLAFESLGHAHEDWYWLLQSQPAIWRPIGAVVGIAGYVLTLRWLSGNIRNGDAPQSQAIRVAYAAAAVSAVVAGLMWRPEPLRSALEAFLVLGVAPLGLLRIARMTDTKVGHDVGPTGVQGSWIWIGVSAVLFSAFLYIQASGAGPMAASRLSSP